MVPLAVLTRTVSPACRSSSSSSAPPPGVHGVPRDHRAAVDGARASAVLVPAELARVVRREEDPTLGRDGEDRYVDREPLHHDTHGHALPPGAVTAVTASAAWAASRRRIGRRRLCRCRSTWLGRVVVRRNTDDADENHRARCDDECDPERRAAPPSGGSLIAGRRHGSSRCLR